MHCVLVANPGEITGLAFDASSNHLAVCNCNSIIQVFGIEAMMNLRAIFSVTIGDYVPKAIAFGQMASEHRELLVFGLHDGQM